MKNSLHLILNQKRLCWLDILKVAQRVRLLVAIVWCKE